MSLDWMQDYVASEEEIQKLVSMGFERVKNSFSLFKCANHRIVCIVSKLS